MAEKRSAYRCKGGMTFCSRPIVFCTPVQAACLLGRTRQLMLFVRHGATEWNTLSKLQGRVDIPLCEEGLHQAEKCADFIEKAVHGKLPLKGIYCSPLSRAYDTASVIGKALEHPEPFVVDGLIEREYGSLTGMTYAERKKKYKSPSDYPDDMETIPDTTARNKRVVGEIRRFEGSGISIVVTHGGVLNALFSGITRGRAGCNGNITANCAVAMAAVGCDDIIPLVYNLGGADFSKYMSELIAYIGKREKRSAFCRPAAEFIK